MVQQIYQLALGWGHGKGGSGEEEKGGREEVKWEGGGGRMDEADLATVMEWGFEWEGLVGEGVEGGCDHTEAELSKSIRDLVFFLPTAV